MTFGGSQFDIRGSGSQLNVMEQGNTVLALSAGKVTASGAMQAHALSAVTSLAASSLLVANTATDTQARVHASSGTATVVVSADAGNATLTLQSRSDTSFSLTAGMSQLRVLSNGTEWLSLRSGSLSVTDGLQARAATVSGHMQAATLAVSSASNQTVSVSSTLGSAAVNIAAATVAAGSVSEVRLTRGAAVATLSHDGSAVSVAHNAFTALTVVNSTVSVPSLLTVGTLSAATLTVAQNGMMTSFCC